MLSASLAVAQEDPHRVHLQANAPQVQAPGYGTLAFEAPAPGTYALPALGPAGDGQVLRSDGSSTTLHSLMDGERLSVLSFIYTRCPDPNGCPLATHVLKRLRREIDTREGLVGEVQFLTLSFDPAWDTPQVIGEYAALVDRPTRENATPWQFLTTASPRALAPILAAYDQTVIESVDGEGNALGAYSHILRVYLIDRRRELRNIYNVGFLHPDILAADLLTLLDER